MAWTVGSATAENLMIKIIKGNENTGIYLEDHSAQEFQAALADGKDRNKAVFIKSQLAILGVRRDYFSIEIPYTVGASGGTDYAGKNSVYLELIEFSAVPPQVQYDIFGEYSPFVTPKMAVDRDMITGIDRQQVSLNIAGGFSEHNSATAGSFVSRNKIRGVIDTRIETRYSSNDPTASDGIAYIKITALPDGVFLLRRGSVVWADKGIGKIADKKA